MNEQDQEFIQGFIQGQVAGIVTVLAEVIKALPISQDEKISLVTQFNVYQISKDSKQHAGIHAFLGTLAEEIDKRTD